MIDNMDKNKEIINKNDLYIKNKNSIIIMNYHYKAIVVLTNKVEVATGNAFYLEFYGTFKLINPVMYPSFVHLIESEVIPVHTLTISSDWSPKTEITPSFPCLSGNFISVFFCINSKLSLFNIFLILFNT